MLFTRLKNILKQLNLALQLLAKNDPMRLAGATAFFTTFALPPILIILIQLLSLLFNRRTISRQLFTQLASIVGRDSVHQLISTLRGFRGLASNWPLAVIGFIFMLFVATTLFKVIQSSLNQLWMIRRTGKRKFTMALTTRVKSLLVIVLTGILFLASLLADSLQAFFGKHIEELLPGTDVIFSGSVSVLISISIVWIWFSVLYKFLPDGKPSWRIALTGGLLTSVLFTLGKLILKWALPGSNIGEIYGTSAALVLLLLFVFYSSLIFYYGAAFTKVWSVHVKDPIIPITNASQYDYTDLEREVNPTGNLTGKNKG
jgi:membrane protein